VLGEGGPAKHSSTWSVSTASRTKAEEHAECAICFDPLCAEQCSYFVDGAGRRVCLHYFHERCAADLPKKECPLCRAAYSAMRPVPSIDEDARKWFECVDADGNGSLNQVELLEALKTQLPVDWARLEKQMIPGQWGQFDPDGDGNITFDELIRHGGVVSWISRTFPNRNRPPAPPVQQKLEWFRYWDEDGSGELDQEEAIRALAKTFQLSHNLARIQVIREVVVNVWCIFDTDGGGGIDQDEFVKADGLADTIIASLT